MTKQRTAGRKKPRDLFDDLETLGRSVPEAAWKRLPPDFNDQLDHYLYGTPKRKALKR